ncbi:hypothetical protein [Sphingomonas sp. ID1715]|nr:hypothetical protein [Sphingomonas sp. ID1715]
MDRGTHAIDVPFVNRAALAFGQLARGDLLRRTWSDALLGLSEPPIGMAR